MANASISNTLNHLSGWLEADISTYKEKFSCSSSITRNPSDRTKSPEDLLKNANPLPNFTLEIGYLTIPIAISILGAMEYVGFCLNGDKEKYSATKINIEKFYSTVLGILSNPPQTKEIEILIRMFRHGVAHKYFPKKGLAVGYFDYSKQLVVPFSDGDALNIYILIENIQEGLNYIKSRTDLHPLMEQCYNDYLDNHEH